MKNSLNWFKQLSITKKVLSGVGVLAVLGIIVGATSQPTNLNISPAKSDTSAASLHGLSTKPHVPVVTTTTEAETQTIPFTSTTVNTSSLAQGVTKVTTAGVNGSQTLTYQVTTTDGQQTDKKLVSTTVTAQPVTQVTSVGTYVAPVTPPAPSCPNGTYVNSAGNTVCSPYASPSAPAGATAKCGDGTYSFSQSRSGTCSHHGGVAEWL